MKTQMRKNVGLGVFDIVMYLQRRFITVHVLLDTQRYTRVIYQEQAVQ